jgi:hypothetical protein
MPSFTSQRDAARRDAEIGYQRCLKAVEQGVSPDRVLLGGAMPANFAAESRQRLADAREQQAHFRGQVYTSVRPIAQRIAGQPLRLARLGPRPGSRRRQAESRCLLPGWVRELAQRSTTGADIKAHEQIEVVDQHPVLDALHRPAPSVPGWNDWCLKYVSVASLEVTGYAYWWFPTVAGRREVWYLPSHWVRPVSGPAGLFSGWAVRADGQADESLLPPEAIAPFWYPDPAHPLRGLGPLEAGGRAVMIDEFVQEAQKRAFQLGIHPGAIVTVGTQMTKQGRPVRPKLRQYQQQQIREAINARYRGLTHFGEALIKDALIESIEPWGNKPKEMDFGGNMDRTQARVEQTFGTPPYIAGAAGLGSRAESGEADRHFVHQTVNPKIELLSRVLTTCVLPRFDASGDYVLFIEPARPHDSEMESKEWEDGLKYACVTVNEYRSHVLRLPPLPGGDVAVLPSAASYVAIGGTGAAAALPATAAVPEPEPPSEEDEEMAEGDVAG